MKWMLIFDNFIVLFFCAFLILITIFMIACSFALSFSNKSYIIVFFVSIIVGGLLIYGLIHNGLFTFFNTTDNEKMIIRKADEFLDESTGYIPKGQGPLHYTVTIDKENYTFILSEIGMHVDKIYKNEILLYESKEENIDESLYPKKRLATAKVREITGNESAFIKNVSNGEYTVESENKLYKVKFSLEDEGIEYVAHNDTIIYRR